MAEVRLAGVRKAWGDAEVVRGLDLTVGDGEIVALLGGSGCGKTTTLRMIAGLERPSAGEIAIGGQVVSSDRVFVPPEARRLGMVFQSYAVWPHLDVLHNVSFPLERQGVRDAATRAREALARVRLQGLEDRLPSQLSGGQQQRVALARALVAEPRVLLLDEPLSNLDARLREEMREEIRELVKRVGLTAILVTHDHEEAFVVADRVALMDQGVVLQVGAPAELYERPRHDRVARFFGLEELPAERRGDHAVVQGVAVPVLPTAEAPAAGACTLGFRLEAADLGSGGIPGVVVARSQLGGSVRWRVDVGGRSVRVAGGSAGDAQVGERVTVRVARGFALAG